MRRSSSGILLLVVGVVLHLAFAFFLAHREAVWEEGQRADNLQRWLRGFALTVRPVKVLERLGKDLADGCLGQTHPRALAFLEAFPRRNRLPAGFLEAFLFDSLGRAINAPASQRASVEACYNLLREDLLASPSIPPARERAVIRFLNGGVGFEQIRGRPGRVGRLNAAGRRTWGAWIHRHQPAPTLAAGVLLLFSEDALPPWRLARLARRTPGFRTDLVGFVDRARPASSCLPPGIRNRDLGAVLQAFLASDEGRVRIGGRLVVCARGPQSLLLVGVLPPSTPVLPRWSLALLFLWLPLAIRAWMVGTDRFLPLPGLLAALMGISCLLPLGVTLGFWRTFEANRLRSLVAETLSSMEDRLVEIDASFPTLMRRRLQIYRQEFQALKENRLTLEAFLRNFTRLELAGMFDTFLMVSSEATLLRPFTNSGIQVRRLALLPPERRQAWLQTYVDSGLNPRNDELELIRDFRFDGSNGAEFIGHLRSPDAGSLRQLVTQVTRDFIRAYDRKQGLTGEADEANLTSLVVGSVMDGEGGNPSELFSSHFGEFVTLGTANTVTQSFIDVIPGPDGRGKYCGVIFHQIQALEHSFWKMAFRGKRPWPEGFRYYALTESPMTVSFPRLRSGRPFRTVMERLVPPRRLLSEVVRRGPETFLLAGMACPHLPHYILIATLPYDRVLVKLQALRRRLAAAALLLSAMVLLLAWRLYEGIARPAGSLMRGIQAMEAREHQHRIEIHTGDEWEGLAGAFNQALSGLEELEVASLVQTRLLPAGPIQGGPWIFQGRSLMTSQVGGDYFDAFPREDGSLLFLVGDVSGHSVSAALVVAMAKAGFVFLATRGTSRPDEILETLNGLLLTHVRKVKMMTCFVGLARPDGVLVFSNAGQSFPLLLEPGAVPRSLEMAGFPLGTFRKGVFRSQEASISPGSRLVLFTDGLVEAVNPEGEQFSYERLEKALVETADLPAAGLFETVSRRVKAFTRSDQWADDITLALLEHRLGTSGSVTTGSSGTKLP